MELCKTADDKYSIEFTAGEIVLLEKGPELHFMQETYRMGSKPRMNSRNGYWQIGWELKTCKDTGLLNTYRLVKLSESSKRNPVISNGKHN